MVVPGTGETLSQLNTAAVNSGYPSYADQIAGQKSVTKSVVTALTNGINQMGTVPPANSPQYAAWVGNAFKIVEAAGIRGNRDAMLTLYNLGLVPEALVPKKA
jgi:hypothetical protein